MDLISVIVPVYRVEAYLDRCVRSILEQTYTNLEIILVDDGSPDRCPQMCDAWARQDQRIRVIHKANGGLSDARNAGMASATGKYIAFVDSDDWIEADMYRMLYDKMMEYDSDISACGVEMVFEDGSAAQKLTQNGSCVLEAQEAMQAVIEESWIQAPVWYKLYKAELIGSIPFPVGKYHEDVFWTYQAVGKAKRVVVFDQIGYHYTQRSGSIMGTGYSLKRLDALEAKMQRIQFVQAHYPDMVRDAKTDLSFFCLWSEQKVLRSLSGCERQSGLSKIEEVWKQLYDAKPRTMKECFWLKLGRISLRYTAKLRNVLHIGL